MGNIFACVIRSQVSAFGLGSLSNNYVKRCSSCGARQYTSSSACRFCGGDVLTFDHDGATTNVVAHRNAIPVILAHDGETNQIIRFIRDHRGALVRVGMQSPDGRSHSGHPVLDIDMDRNHSIHTINEDFKRFQEDLSIFPKTNDVNLPQISAALFQLVGRDGLSSNVKQELRTALLASNANCVPSSELTRSTHEHSFVNFLSHFLEQEILEEDSETSMFDISRAVDQIRNVLSCPICLSQYKQAVTLPCGHSMCLSHLGDFAGDDDSTNKLMKCSSCPCCRENIPPVLLKLGKLMGHQMVEDLTETEFAVETKDMEEDRCVIVVRPSSDDGGDDDGGGNDNTKVLNVGCLINKDIECYIEFVEKVAELVGRDAHPRLARE